MKETGQIDNQYAVVSTVKANDNLVLKNLYQDNYKKVENLELQLQRIEAMIKANLN